MEGKREATGSKDSPREPLTQRLLRRIPKLGKSIGLQLGKTAKLEDQLTEHRCRNSFLKREEKLKEWAPSTTANP